MDCNRVVWALGRFGLGRFGPESFRPNFGVGRFGLGRWVDSALGRFVPGSFRPKSIQNVDCLGQADKRRIKVFGLKKFRRGGGGGLGGGGQGECERRFEVL